MCVSKRGEVICMKNFKEFEELLASEECQAEWKVIYDKLTDTCEADQVGTAIFASTAAMERSHFELRKYHDWLNN